jgi:hypothetical protein
MNKASKSNAIPKIFLVLACAFIQFSCDSKDASQKYNQTAKSTTIGTVQTPEQQAEDEKRQAHHEEARREARAAALGLRWEYEEHAEKMGRGTVKFATVRSLNEVEFDFPYRAPQRATLELRTHPKYGKDVILSIEKGQFLCGIQSCKVSVRFDNGKVQNYSANEPADHRSTILFLRGYDRFLASARQAKKVYIEAMFYQEGTRVFEFDISGLKW